ncbi:hypothetical protein [Butyrivibrio sp.]|nr:hypothetical protein [Butyrivibrio sp.]
MGQKLIHICEVCGKAKIMTPEEFQGFLRLSIENLRMALIREIAR